MMPDKPDGTILEYATVPQIIDELKRRHKAGLVIVAKETGLNCGEWGDSAMKLGLLQLVSDTIRDRHRSKVSPGINEDA